MMRKSQSCVWSILVTVLAGCSGSNQKLVTLVRAGGIVTLDGEPLEGAVVIFEAAAGAFSYARTDSRGRYTLSFDSTEKGVTPGRKTVRISMKRRIKGLNSTDEGSPSDPAGGWFPRQPPERV